MLRAENGYFVVYITNCWVFWLMVTLSGCWW